jgi:hypothetical protein
MVEAGGEALSGILPAKTCSKWIIPHSTVKEKKEEEKNTFSTQRDQLKRREVKALSDRQFVQSQKGPKCKKNGWFGEKDQKSRRER